jgi:(1->4)-alpha-D-glucan 1-alpha-D-glucosylmutase
MLATSTHDTKLGEDARMRVHVLAELADEWSDAVSRWQRLTSGARRRLPGGWAPDGNDVYRFYQTLVACWPTDALGLETAPDGLVERLQQYMIKATREAKLHTSWVTENHEYESAVEHFVARVLSGPAAARFLRAFDPMARRVTGLGAIYSLAQLALKLASPGVPDFYQGSEFWTLTLVDPDNRRPVDFEARLAALDALEPLLAGLESADPVSARPDVTSDAAALAGAWPDGRVKLYMTAVGLRLRRAHPDLFLAGEYLPLEADVPAPAGVVAFARRRDRRTVIVVVPRLIARIADPLAGPAQPAAWGDARLWLPADLADSPFVDVFTGAHHIPTLEPDGRVSLPLNALLGRFPVAMGVSG